MRDLSVIIPSRNEEFLGKTIENVLENIEADTEVIVILDGYWPDPGIPDNERVTLIHHTTPIGQRAATNEGVRASQAKYVMKLDAHCAVDKGFDKKLMETMEPDWTVIPRMYNLHAFDWVCKNGHNRYQGPSGPCEKCGEPTEKQIIWKPRKSRMSDYMRFDKDLKFAYWGAYKYREEAKGDIIPIMSFLGACWFMERDRYLELEGLDEKHGSWGQVGTEVACKSWLSGGKLMVNKKTWFAHMFRTQGGDFSFPYSIKGSDQSKARKYSQKLWKGDKWPKAKHDLNWLIDKFSPVPGWESKAILYYTDNQLDPKVEKMCQDQLKSAAGSIPIYSVSLKPMDFGKNIVVEGKRSYETMFKQILAGLENIKEDIVFFCEHDVLYHESHFEFVPNKPNKYFYNVNVWKIRMSDGLALKVNECKMTSGLCAHHKLLLDHYRERDRRIGKEGFSRKIGFEPGTHNRKEKIDEYGCAVWRSNVPNLDLVHGRNRTHRRWKREEYRNQKYTKGWTESHVSKIDGWDVKGF